MGNRYERLDAIVAKICDDNFSLMRIKRGFSSLKDSSDIIYVGNELWKKIVEKDLECNLQITSFLRDIICKANERTRKLSTRDSLTGLFNRRFLDLKLKTQLASTYRNLEDPFSVIMFDIDHFKKFNDTYGHNAGDTVLKTLSSVVSKSLRGSDIAFRYGGEEFFILLGNASKEDALDVAYRLNRLVAKTKVTFLDEKGREHKQPLTISVGVGEVNRDNPIWLLYGAGGKKLVIDYVNKAHDINELLDEYIKMSSKNRSFFSRWGGSRKKNLKKNLKKIGSFVKY